MVRYMSFPKPYAFLLSTLLTNEQTERIHFMLIIIHFTLVNYASLFTITGDATVEYDATESVPLQRFKFQCNDDAYVTRGSQKVHCQQDCEICANSICSKTSVTTYGQRDEFKYEFSCPSTDISDGDCKDQCDSKRRQGSTDGYTLNCERDHGRNSYEARDCQSKCGSCPHWVCDPEKDNNVYYCPTVASTCADRCDQVREHQYRVERRAFSFECRYEFSLTSDERETCRDDCGNCPRSICNPYNSKENYNCPALPDAVPTPPPPNREYNGKCKERCENFRLGGHGAYSFKCQDVFDDSGERDACYDDCDLCPEDVCKLKGKETLGQFNCPEDREYKERMERERYEEEEREIGRKNTLKSSEGHLIAIIFGILGFILISAIAGCCTRKNWRKKGDVRLQQEQGLQQEQYGYGIPFEGQNQVSLEQELPLQPQPGDPYMSAPPGPGPMSVPSNPNSPGIPSNQQQFGNENKGVL